MRGPVLALDTVVQASHAMSAVSEAIFESIVASRASLGELGGHAALVSRLVAFADSVSTESRVAVVERRLDRFRSRDGADEQTLVLRIRVIGETPDARERFLDLLCDRVVELAAEGDSERAFLEDRFSIVVSG